MVQRKVLGSKTAGDIQDDLRHPKAKKRLDSSSQTLLQGKNKVSESKKIMKNSASIKLSQDHHIKNAAPPGKTPGTASSQNLEIHGCQGSELKKKKITKNKVSSFELSDVDNLISLPNKKNISQPGKPPTSQEDDALVPNKAKKSSDSPKPNYRKATSCWDARKDSNQQVSVQSDVGSSSSGAKNQARRNLKNSKFDPLASAPGRSLAVESSSLKLGRTLTKSLSFKQTGSVKKSSISKKAVLCADMCAQRATCSSLLKDSKFPSYVTLRPGGTESEGSSVLKVCTYKYCSLNGHHHAIVPPLKSFVAARRRSLKNQKSMKLEDTVPKAENETGLEVTHVEVDDSGLFLEVYASWKEENVEPTKTETKAADDAEAENETGLVRENRSEECSEVDHENTAEESDKRTSTGGGNVERTVEAQHNEELYESVWEAYEMKWQEFEFIDASIHDHIYLEKEEVEEAKFDCRSEGSIAVSDDDVRNLFEDEAEGVCDENSESHEQVFQDQTVQADALVYESCIFEDDHEQKVTTDVLPETLASDSAQNFDEIDEEGNEADQSTNVHSELGTDFDAGENGDIDEEDETEKSSFNQESKEVVETATPHEVDNVAEETANSDTKKGEVRKDANEDLHGDTLVGRSYCRAGKEKDLDHSDSSNHLIITRYKAEMEDLDNTRGFNPQDPNFLPLQPEPEPEKVDLRHQDIDERKNSEEWMVDYALQKTLTKLAPVKRKKVELLVEAFEAVAPTPKHEHLSRRASYPPPDTRTIQPCSFLHHFSCRSYPGTRVLTETLLQTAN